MPTLDTMLILGLIVLLLVLGPTKLPQFAKAIGEAVREFRRASSAVVEEPQPQREAPRTQQPQQVQQTQAPAPTEIDTNNAIVAAAIKEGIDVRGKSIEQIAEELAKKLKEKKAAGASYM
ncbi:MAG TPA: twin-arginine translocase TatA/TatE family subunit [Sulfolobales archaeon]|nr:twin-arginine translocase TatA/TatE family subunit [Sulfolobales archaeon]